MDAPHQYTIYQYAVLSECKQLTGYNNYQYGDYCFQPQSCFCTSLSFLWMNNLKAVFVIDIQPRLNQQDFSSFTHPHMYVPAQKKLFLKLKIE